MLVKEASVSLTLLGRFPKYRPFDLRSSSKQGSKQSMSLQKSVTETPNDITETLDSADVAQIVKMFDQSDEQLFDGWQLGGLCSKEFQASFTSIVEQTRATFQENPKSIIVLSGAGTSGRLAWLCADESRIRYLSAGGEEALITAREGAEDNTTDAKADLQRITEETGASHVIYVGITCGLSAPYVAAQLAYAMEQGSARFTPLLLGFNPIQLARDLPIEGWDGRSFLSVATALSQYQGGHVINPVVGPESLTGSTRMKGGSATKILLETLLFLTTAPQLSSPLPDLVPKLLDYFRAAKHESYRQFTACGPRLTELITGAGKVLQQQGKVAYVSSGRPGLLALVDASECVPTFGASFEDVQCFFRLGWTGISTQPVPANPMFHFSWEDYQKRPRPAHALVLTIHDPDNHSEMLALEQQLGEEPFVPIYLDIATPPPSHGLAFSSASLPSIQGFPGRPGLNYGRELLLKLFLNLLSTAAHVFAGKVFGNRMIDLQISNNKLYFRSIGIVADIAGVTKELAETSVLRAIYSVESVGPERGFPISQHVLTSRLNRRVVPTAILLSRKPQLTVQEAREIASRIPLVRDILQV
jgi:N-acetylmuramic acid 6-phosphate (MurNAc-6-P) etherase